MQSLQPRGDSLQSPVSVDTKFSISEAWMGVAFPSPRLFDGEVGSVRNSILEFRGN